MGLEEAKKAGLYEVIGQEVDDVNRSLQVYARVKEPNSRFRPGMYVSAKIRKND